MPRGEEEEEEQATNQVFSVIEQFSGKSVCAKKPIFLPLRTCLRCQRARVASLDQVINGMHLVIYLRLSGGIRNIDLVCTMTTTLF